MKFREEQEAFPSATWERGKTYRRTFDIYGGAAILAYMKIAAHIAASLLGLIFIAFSLLVLLHLVSPPPPPAGSPVASFMEAFVPTGYLTFVKIFELIGGILVVIPKLRNLGLLILGPIILNILAFHIFIAKGEGLVGIPLLIAALALFLLWTERKAFAGLIH